MATMPTGSELGQQLGSLSIIKAHVQLHCVHALAPCASNLMPLAGLCSHSLSGSPSMCSALRVVGAAPSRQAPLDNTRPHCAGAAAPPTAPSHPLMANVSEVAQFWRALASLVRANERGEGRRVDLLGCRLEESPQEAAALLKVGH